MTERNTDNLGAFGTNQSGSTVNSAGAVNSVQAQMEANARAQQILMTRQMAGNSAAQQMARNNRARTEIRGKINEIVGRQEQVAITGSRSMAEMNLASEPNFLAGNKKVFYAVFGIVAVLLIGTGVVIGINSMESNNKKGDSDVALNYTPDGYGDNPSSSTVVAVFDEEISEKLESDENYTIEDAKADYENAYNESEGEVRLDVLLAYANRIYSETGNADEAVATLLPVASVLTDDFDIMRFYTTIINIYDRAGMAGQANYYRDMLKVAVTPAPLTDEEKELTRDQ